MGGNWTETTTRKPGDTAPGGESPSEWYRRKIDELTLHDQFVDLWDRQRDKRQAAQGQGAPPPWEGISQIAQSLGINLGELWKTREEELKATRDAADATSKELHELRLREIDNRVKELQTMADKVAQQTAETKGNQPKSFLEKLDEMTGGFVSKRIAAMFGGDNKDEPRDPVEELVNRLDQTDKLKERLGLGVAGGGGAQALAQSGIRGELLKLLLEDERDRLKMQYEHEVQVERNKHLGGLASVVKENLGDGIQALKAAAQEIQKTGTAAAPKPEASQGPQAYECGACKTRFTIPTTEGWEQVKCPNPNCGRTWSRQEVLGS